MAGTYVKVYVPPDVVSCVSPRVSISSYIRFRIQQEIERNQKQVQKKQHEIVIKYMPVVLDRATKWFKLSKGVVPLEDLIAIGQQEALKAAQRFDFGRGTSFAPYVRMWADYGCRDLVKRTQTYENTHQGLPDAQEGEWEEVHTEADEQAPERSELREEIEAFILLLSGKQQRSRRRQIQALLGGLQGDEAAQVAKVSVQELLQTQQLLKEFLTERGLGRESGAQDLTLSELSERTQIPLKSLYKQLTSGKIQGYKLQGTWRIPWSEVASLFSPTRESRGHVDAPSEDP